MELLTGRVALISGVGAGIGTDCAIVFAREGADVVLVARSTSVPEAVARQVRALGRRALVVSCDITDAASCERAATNAVAELGGIDVLVNVAYHRSIVSSLLEASPDLSEWRPLFEVNVFGTLQMTKAVAHSMVELGRGGSIIMVNSMASERTRYGFSSYTGSKSALERIVRTLAIELAPHRIRVNSLHPGYMWGDWMAQVMEARAAENGTTAEREKAAVVAEIPLGHMPSTAEYCGTLLYLASDLSSPTTGQAIHVNGGQHFH